MTFSLSRTPALTLAMLALLACAACAGGPSTRTAPVVFNCSGRVPPQLRADVLAPDLPGDNTVGAWVVFADGAVGRIGEGNDKKNTILWIIEHCEGEALEAARDIDGRPFWRKWLDPLTAG